MKNKNSDELIELRLNKLMIKTLVKKMTAISK